MVTRILIILVLANLISACGSRTENTSANNEGENVLAQDSGAFAKGFDLLNLGTHRELILRGSDHKHEFVRYYLLSEGQHAPAGVDPNSIIHTPVRSVVCGSTGHASFFSALGRIGAITGLAYADRAMDPSVTEAVNSNSMINISGGNELDVEKVIELDPDLVIIYPSMAGVAEELWQAGIKVMYFSDHRETHPLGRAEWVRVIGAILDDTENAQVYFDELQERYEEVRHKALRTSTSPLVFFGSIWKGVVQAPGGRSASAQLLRDAGTRYLFEDNKSIRGIAVDVEVLLDKGSKADFWGMVLAGDPTGFVNEMEKANPLLMTLDPVKKRNILYCDTERSDYFGRGMLEPDVLLSDLVHILHPGYLPDHDLVYFRKIEQ